MTIKVRNKGTAALSALSLVGATVLTFSALQGGAVAFGPQQQTLPGALYLGNNSNSTTPTTVNTFTSTFTLTQSPADPSTGASVDVTLSGVQGPRTGPVPVGANGQIVRSTINVSGAMSEDVVLSSGTTCNYPAATIPAGGNDQGPWTTTGSYTATGTGAATIALKQVFFDDGGNLNGGADGAQNRLCQGTNFNADYFVTGEGSANAKTDLRVSTSVRQDFSITAPAPEVTLVKQASPAVLSEGDNGLVEYRLTIGNPSASITSRITDLTDDKVDLTTTTCDELLLATVAPGDEVSCTYGDTLDTSSPASFTNVASVTVEDVEGGDPTGPVEDSVTVEVVDVTPTVELTKTAQESSLAAPADFIFNVEIINTSPEAVDITESSDSEVADFATECPELATGVTLAAGASAACEYTVSRVEPGDFTNTVDVVVADDEGNSTPASASTTVVALDVSASVIVNQVATPTSLPEPGGDFAVEVTIQSGSTSPQTIDSVTTGLDGSTCDDLVGDALGPAAEVTCEYTLTKATVGTAEQVFDVATSVDDPASTDTDSSTVSVEVTDVAPVLSVTKLATPGEVTLPNGDVEYTVTITNESDDFDTITVTSLTDDQVEIADTDCGNLVDAEIAPGDSSTCVYSVTLDSPGSVTNTIEVVAVDEEGTPTTVSDEATVVVLAEEVPTTPPPTSAPPTTEAPTTPGQDVPSRVTEQVTGINCFNTLLQVSPWPNGNEAQGGGPPGEDPTITLDMSPAQPEPGAPVSVFVQFDEGIANGPTTVNGSIKPVARVLLSGGVEDELIISGLPYQGVTPDQRFPGQRLTAEDAFLFPTGGETVFAELTDIVFDSNSGGAEGGTFNWPGSGTSLFTTVCNKGANPSTDPVPIGLQVAVPFGGETPEEPTPPPPPPTTSATEEPPPTLDPTETTIDESPTALPQTGPLGTVTSLVLAALLFQIGLILAVRSMRAQPRTVARH